MKLAADGLIGRRAHRGAIKAKQHRSRKEESFQQEQLSTYLHKHFRSGHTFNKITWL